MFQTLGTDAPSLLESWYTPSRHSSMMRKGPSHMGESLFFLHTIGTGGGLDPRLGEFVVVRGAGGSGGGPAGSGPL